MFNPSRDQVRQFFCATWQKFEAQQPLMGAEIAAAAIISQHPEYHALLRQTETALQQNWTPAQGTMNPFLHLSLHLAVQEQVDIDQPYGIRLVHEQLLQRMDKHSAD
ncbi:MAG: DUF1841 family protein, partial [Azonexus sp.]|nr:DUF1841 family protein [Azonexus sp.]